jgi:hypothetical protein
MRNQKVERETENNRIKMCKNIEDKREEKRAKLQSKASELSIV